MEKVNIKIANRMSSEDIVSSNTCVMEAQKNMNHASWIGSAQFIMQSIEYDTSYKSFGYKLRIELFCACQEEENNGYSKVDSISLI